MIHQSSPLITEEEIAAVAGVMRSGMLAQGAEVAAFEDEFASAFDTGHAAAVSNGTTALVVALQAIGVGAGDEVIVPSFTFAATANAVALFGARPVFADIDDATLNIDPDHVKTLLTDNTRAIIAVHLYGQMAPMSQLRDIAGPNGIRLIEDAAQAHGAQRDGLAVGALSDLATYSFYPTKNMTTGEGGMVTGHDPDLIEAVKLYRNHGMAERYHHDVIGSNARMTDIAAAIGRVQLRKLPGWNERRREIAARYDELLAGAVRTPEVADGALHVYHQYTIRSDQRDAIAAICSDSGVGHGIYYPIPCHRQKSFRKFAGAEDLPVTDRAAKQVLSLPMRPTLTEAEIESVTEAVTRGAQS